MRAKLIAAIVVLLLALSLPSSVLAQDEETLVFRGWPLIKVESSFHKTLRSETTETQSAQYHVLIVKRGGKYYWASRENLELLYVQSGAYHWFFAPSSGYVKIQDSALVTDDESSPYTYMENLTVGLLSITYWGAAESFEP